MSLDINRPDLTVGVVGTGAMGRGIAQVTAQGGIKAILFDAAASGDLARRLDAAGVVWDAAANVDLPALLPNWLKKRA